MANGCIFENGNDLTFGQSLWSCLCHFGQCINERGLLGFFNPDAYTAGWRRGLTEGPGGTVDAKGCWWGSGIIIENTRGRMGDEEKEALKAYLLDMRTRLGKELDWNYPEPTWKK